MSRVPGIQRVAESIIRGSCRRLPEEQRDERYREWSAELPAILEDRTVRPGFMRAIRALTYAAGIAATTVRLRHAASRSNPAGGRSGHAPSWRSGAVRPGLAVRAVCGLLIWVAAVIVVISSFSTFRDAQIWLMVPVLALAVGFAAYCLADIARAGSVRWLPKWAWAIICLIQVPGGGIVYFTFGRVGRAGSLPPGTVRQP